MDALQPWLAATIEGELSDALRHWEDATNRHQSTGKSRGLSYDDGSNLRIPSAKKGPVVQITKFSTYKDPIQVTLSDSYVRVNASITNQASQRYAQEHRKELTEGTVGGLIQLHEFEIVATHLGPRDRRLTLYVKDFKSLGANGSGDFGVAPQAIESREGTKELLNKLADLRRNGSDAHSRQSTNPSPIRSQPSTQTSEVRIDQDSQIGFVTQVPRSIAPVDSKQKLPGPTTTTDVGSTSTANSAKSLAPPTKAIHGNPLANNLGLRQARAAPPNASVNSKLLSLLENHKRSALAPEFVPGPTTKQPPGQVAASSGPSTREMDNEASRVDAFVSSDDHASRIPGAIQKRKRLSANSTPRKKVAKYHISHGIDKDRMSLANQDLESRARSGVAVNEASVDTYRSQPSSPSVLGSTKLRLNPPKKPSRQPHLKLTSSASAQNTGRNRISSRDVNIPKDQETLLNRADSWLPAEPGQREPTANIPISLLTTLNRKADLSAQRSNKIRKQRDDTMTSSAVIDPTADSETDNPVSSGQWPASPERNQLPPDSSFENAEHSDRSIPGTLTTSRSVSAARKQSHASNFSCPTPSGQPSPISTEQYSRESVSSDTAAPGLLSPSGTSTSAGEEVHDDSDSIAVSASILPLLDEGSKGLREEDVSKRGSSTNSALGAKSIPAAPPTKTPSKDIYVAKERYSPLFLASPTPESDLEMTIPLALENKSDPVASSAPMQRFPSTASQPQDPFTQVKRTPYVNGRVLNGSLPGWRTVSSPLKSNFYPLANGNANDDIDFVSASVASCPEPSTAETSGERGRPNALEHRSAGGIPKSNNQETTESSAKTADSLIAEVHQETSRAEAAADKPDDSVVVGTESQSQISDLSKPAVAAEAKMRDPKVPEEPSTPDGNRNHHATSNDSAQSAHGMKRKVAESGFMSPSIAKRQKRFKIPSAFTFTERSEVPRDPSEGARQFRQDFLASRRSSESSTPTMSPTMSFAIVPGATPEKLRDPSERARQIRQEFLASRRNSETSTPTTSPKIQVAAFTRTVQAEQQNPEAGNVEQVTSQNQSVDFEIQRQNMTEVTELSRIQGLKLDTAPFPSGISLIEPDGGNAKPDASENASSDHEACSPIFAAQNPDIGCFVIEQGTVIETSSLAFHDKAHRVQSVEVDISVRSLNHHETENGFVEGVPNADADQTVELGVDMKEASNDQLADINKEPCPVGPESNKAWETSPARAEEVAEQGSNVSMPTLGLNHVSEHAPTSLQERCSIEEKQHTPIRDTTASDPKHQQHLDAMDAKTSLLDEIATELSSQEKLIGVHTHTPMHDSQVVPDTTLEAVGETWNQIPPQSSVVPAFEDDSIIEVQPHGSPTASSLIVPPSCTTPKTKIGRVESRQKAQESPSVPQSIFDKFKAAYPAYPGDMNHFVTVCKKISQLVKANRMEHQSLWDDFIVRHKVEYSQYTRRCAIKTEDALPYEAFYQTEIEGPQYQKRVINRRNLDEALALLAQQPSPEALHAEPIEDEEPLVKPVGPGFTFESGTVIEKVHHEYTTAEDDEPLVSVRTETAPQPAVSYKLSQKPSDSRVYIDLTEDDPPDNSLARTKGKDLPSSIAGNLRRSLPWEGSDHCELLSSANATPSESPKRLPGSGPREIRAKEACNARDAHLPVSAKSSPNGPKQSQGWLNTCHRVIQSNWGIKAHEVLEPGYCRGQVWSNTMIELLAEIASKVKVGEARDRLKEAIENRIRDHAQRSDGGPGQERRILRSDLEVVRAVVVTSSMSTTSPHSPPNTNATLKKQNEGTPSEWWEDDNSPFKTFARAYASIRHGNGNSFAEAGPAEQGDTHEAASSGTQLKKIDIMRWNL